RARRNRDLQSFELERGEALLTVEESEEPAGDLEVLDLDEGGGIGLPFQPQLQTVAMNAQQRERLDAEVGELDLRVQLFIQRLDQLLAEAVRIGQRQDGDPESRQHTEDDPDRPPDELQVPLEHNLSLLQPAGHASAL